MARYAGKFILMIGEVVLSLILVWLVRYVVTTYMTRRKMPPGPFPYPYIGNISHILANPMYPFNKLAEKYGDIYSITLPSGNFVVLNTASLVREARHGKNDDLSGKELKFFYPINEILGNDLTIDFSPVQQFRRRVFTSAMHIFGAGVEQASERAGHAVEMVMQEIDSKKKKPFSPKKLLLAAILVHLWEWLTSKKLALDDPTIIDLSELGAIVAKQAVVANFHHLFPFLIYLPLQINRDIKRAQQIKKDVFPPELKAHDKTFTHDKIRDLTDSFINAYKKEILKESERDIGSFEDISDLMNNVSILGSDTTSSSLDWFFLFMVRHSVVQQKIHEEIDKVVGKNRLPSWRDVHSLPYLQAALCESQRASSMIPLVGTSTTRDTIIAGYHVPQGTFVALNLAKLHLDEREWPEPEKFKPERFLDPDGQFVGWRKLHGFIPFGLGRRDCPGQLLARVVLFTFTSLLLHRYKFEVPEGEEMPTREVLSCGLIVRPTDFKIVAHER